MADCMMFPNDWHDFIKDYSFIDSKQVYTNGSELIQVFRVTQLIEHLLIEHEEQIKNHDESIEKAREEIKWLRGMLKEQEAKYGYWINPTSQDCHCSECGEQPAHEPGESVPLYDFCPYCGAKMEVKWNE